jgi:hypothetical protein
MGAARERGLVSMEGFVLATNRRMLGLMDSLGFQVFPADDDPSVKRVVCPLV